MTENKTKKLFTEISSEESSTINGGSHYSCGCYKKSSYSYKKSYYYHYDYSYHPAYHTGSPRYCH